MIAGISGSRQGPSAALANGGAIAACEESRLARMRLSERTTCPRLAVRDLAAWLGRSERDIRHVGVTAGGQFPGRDVEPVEHHLAHATYAFASSPFVEALVVVCDTAAEAGWSAWRAGTAGLTRLETPAGRFPLAAIYSELTAALGLAPGRDEHVVEAMARAAGSARDDATAAHPAAACFTTCDAGLAVAPEWRDRLGLAPVDRGEGGTLAQTAAAAAVQARLGEALLVLLERLARATGLRRACLAGGLFYNTFFTTAVAQAGVFDEVFVPPHPGNGGAAVGAALVVAGGRTVWPAGVASPFLGPAFSDEQVKATLDNCKLMYSYLPDERLLSAVVDALARGALVGWFDGRMEWGPRALGHRSVLAAAASPHVLDNLNGFLKQRPWYRSYGVMVPHRRLADLFDGPAASPFMQFEYRPRDPDRFRALLPSGASRLRVHSVGDDEPRLARLLDQWEAHTGWPVLVNTSFNGFHEPLVCSPRDAVRVFYGTGLDALAIGHFLLRK